MSKNINSKKKWYPARFETQSKLNKKKIEIDEEEKEAKKNVNEEKSKMLNHNKNNKRSSWMID